MSCWSDEGKRNSNNQPWSLGLRQTKRILGVAVKRKEKKKKKKKKKKN